MNRARFVLANLLILGVIGASTYDIVTRQEHWPFSNYPMFSSVHQRRVLDWPRLYGVTEKGEEYVLIRYPELAPLDFSRLPIGLRAIYRQEGSSPRLHAALSDVLRRYEARRIKGEHDGPPLRAMRLYLVTWPLEPYAANLDRPQSRRLLAQTGGAL